MPSDHVLVKLDFSNAFNSLHRRDMLLAIRDHFPELFHICYSAYSQPSLRFLANIIIESQEGPQQGDPLGPLLFCNTIQPLLDSLLPALTLGFLDDLTLGGAQQSVAADVNHTIEGGQQLGLHLNTAKCEVIASPDTIISDHFFRNFHLLQWMTLPI